MTYWHEKIRLGHLMIPRFIGGPLDGITDSPFRKVIRKFSKDALLYSEMRHVACVAHDKGVKKTLDFEQMERPLSYQFSANSIDCIDRACELVMAAGVDVVDLNIGCPARCVIKSGSGSALMGDLPRLEMILKHFRKTLSIPFTLKIRAGFKEKNAVIVAKLAQDCGVDALAIHPRLQTQMFAGQPDYDLARQVKEAVSIPVFLSGGIVNWATAHKAYEQTGVDGYLIGRGIWSRPWKLHELQEQSQGRTFTVTEAMIGQAALDHLHEVMSYYGPHGAYVFRKHLPFYIKGKPSAGTLRKQLMVSHTAQELEVGLRTFFGL